MITRFFSVLNLLAISCLLVSVETAAQNNEGRDKWAHDHDSLNFSAYDAESGALLEGSSNGYRIYKKESGGGSYIPLKAIGLTFSHFVFPVRGSGGSEWFLINDAGSWTFRLSGSTLTRLDEDADTRMSITMTPFIYRDTIFTHGGYGFWTAREHVSWFDSAEGKWKVHKPLNSTEFPPGILNHWTYLLGDSLFVFGGQKMDPFDPITYLLNKELWRYDISNRRWQKLGMVNAALATPRGKHTRIRIGDRLLLFPIRDQLAEIDFKEGLIRFYKPSSALIDINANGHFNTQGFIEYERYYYCRILNEKDVKKAPSHPSQWVSVPLSELYGEQVGEERLIQPAFSYWWWLVLPVIVGAIFIVRRLPRFADQKIHIVSDGFILRRSKYPAQPEAVSLVNLLLASDGPVSNSAIMEIFKNPSIDYSHSIRLKNQMVENTNILLKSILNVEEDIITSERSADDKRVRMYGIRRAVFRT